MTITAWGGGQYTTTPDPVFAPAFVRLPSIFPGSGPVGTVFSANDGQVVRGDITGRRWLQDGTAIGTGASVSPASNGRLVLEVSASSAGGVVAAYSDPAQVGNPDTGGIPSNALTFQGNPLTYQSSILTRTAA